MAQKNVSHRGIEGGVAEVLSTLRDVIRQSPSLNAETSMVRRYVKLLISWIYIALIPSDANDTELTSLVRPNDNQIQWQNIELTSKHNGRPSQIYQ